MTTSLWTQRVVPNKGKSSRMLRHMHVQYGSVSACQDGDASQKHRVSNARTVTHIYQNYWTSPKEKNQYCTYPNTKSTAEFFRPLTVLHLCMVLFCDAKFHPAVHEKPSVTVALFRGTHCFFSIDPRSWSFLLFFDRFRVYNSDLFDCFSP